MNCGTFPIRETYLDLCPCSATLQSRHCSLHGNDENPICCAVVMERLNVALIYRRSAIKRACDVRVRQP